MGMAFREIAAILEIKSKTKRRAIAKFIIRIAQEEPNLDAPALSARA